MMFIKALAEANCPELHNEEPHHATEVTPAARRFSSNEK
jgi:hypothetical protein